MVLSKSNERLTYEKLQRCDTNKNIGLVAEDGGRRAAAVEADGRPVQDRAAFSEHCRIGLGQRTQVQRIERRPYRLVEIA